ncbi:4-phosphoerythronate dehydrogenase [Rubrivirga sp. S365]|uniref:4-phosphoerythronate dehydrogenase n=1 Tax=Rubrivirga litoralis TaxID=3075598 RepID=A0ABU3BPF1_9BACT|nr:MULTISPECIES: 4-phosphoerythronate dehydrogenase [unclassified Rubrivirga]MDT0631143.1 4-phosphoerythronate dehydrogenase [Rubrivirga sp. F394]MDT7855344.1 4-phosphoerythronate dehydrogenase [Rubrivirga sp. S365]
MDTPLRILADANIPAATDASGALGRVRLLPGREITRAEAEGADVLLVRSVTPVDAALLEGTPVRFVGSATAGTDHVDRPALGHLGVGFAWAPGSNATSVVEHVLAALLAVAADRGEALAGKTLGVVGTGAVGGRLAPRAEALGMSIVASDPPRAAAAEARGEAHPYVPLDAVLAQTDVVTLHTPLTTAAESPWPTRGLFGADAFAAMRPGAWFVNAARGGVVDATALRREAARRPCVLDVWPGEPTPDPETVGLAALGSPHVAGYAADGKVRGTAMLAAALRRWLAAGGAEAAPWDESAALGPDPPPVAAPPAPGDVEDPVAQAAWLDALARQAFSVRAEDARFRAALDAAGGAAERAAAFADLRRTYPARREWAHYAVEGEVPAPLRRAVADGLGMRIAG